MEKEPFYSSLRWWTTVLMAPVTMIVTVVMAFLVQRIPFLLDLGVDSNIVIENIVEIVGLQFVGWIAFVVARTRRNTAIEN